VMPELAVFTYTQVSHVLCASMQIASFILKSHGFDLCHRILECTNAAIYSLSIVLSLWVLINMFGMKYRKVIPGCNDEVSLDLIYFICDRENPDF
jgi:hypothetical protein